MKIGDRVKVVSCSDHADNCKEEWGCDACNIGLIGEVMDIEPEEEFSFEVLIQYPDNAVVCHYFKESELQVL